MNTPADSVFTVPPGMADVWRYPVDAWQRAILFWDVMRQRGNQYIEHAARTAPHVLHFDLELVMSGRSLPHPVNYALVRIRPPAGVNVDERKRPFVIVDPRAGHGPGIGGFKAESEIGVALKEGHPCYFIGFLPEPVPGQTIQDIAHAEAAFLERVIALHPEAEGKPAVIGNCQAGWAVLMLAAVRPELFGSILAAGSPLSYWAGVRGKNPMRYTGGLLGGSWLTALMGDLGNGRFDGAWLVSNFENLNPANTLCTKHYNLYSKIDSEAPRYLGFEQWWGGHVVLNAEEMQYIVDELFVGNRLATAEIDSSKGTAIDLRNIHSPIIVFCSKGDNITPPQQALGWILDLYDSVDDMRAHGQTIVYAVHESVGHLGIFVSGSVAKKEHDEFTSNIDLIDVLPPGLYEAVMTPRDPSAAGADLISGNYLVRFEPRSLDDIRALGGNDEEDERRFAAAARVSDINLGLYCTFVQPWVRCWANEGFAEWMRKLHPLRLQYEMLSDANPFTRGLGALAHFVRENRERLPEDNPLWQAQEWLATQTETILDGYRDARDRMYEELFHAIYGSPLLQALVGLKASDRSPRRRPGKDESHRALVAQRIDELRRSVGEGGPREAAIRALLYIRMPDRVVDERGFTLLQRMREESGSGITLSDFKSLVRQQFFLLLLEERRAVEAIPTMLARNPELAARAAKSLHRFLEVIPPGSEVGLARAAEIERLFRTKHQLADTSAPGEAETVSASPRPARAHAARNSKRTA